MKKKILVPISSIISLSLISIQTACAMDSRDKLLEQSAAAHHSVDISVSEEKAELATNREIEALRREHEQKYSLIQQQMASLEHKNSMLEQERKLQIERIESIEQEKAFLSYRLQEELREKGEISGVAQMASVFARDTALSEERLAREAAERAEAARKEVATLWVSQNEANKLAEKAYAESQLASQNVLIESSNERFVASRLTKLREDLLSAKARVDEMKEVAALAETSSQLEQRLLAVSERHREASDLVQIADFAMNRSTEAMKSVQLAVEQMTVIQIEEQRSQREWEIAINRSRMAHENAQSAAQHAFAARAEAFKLSEKLWIAREKEIVAVTTAEMSKRLVDLARKATDNVFRITERL